MTNRKRFALASTLASVISACAMTSGPEMEGSSAKETVESSESALLYQVLDGPGQAYYTVCNGMHCCPAGFAMAGIHVGNNLFSCRSAFADPSQVASREGCYVDTSTQRSGIHACATNYYMKGVDVSSNRFTCCNDRYRTVRGSDHVDRAEAGEDMHRCDWWAQEAMTGLHVGRNELLCKSWPEP